MEEKSYKDSLNLPKTSFSMKANLAQREPEFIKKWEKEELYSKINASRKDKPYFILHDGPPYANGHIHVGHALNKTLKDIIVKSKTMEGFQSPYIPGWDCHGLPIEHQVMKNLGEKAKSLPLDVIRKECRKYAGKFIDIQKNDFKRLGVFGDFSNPYLTMSLDYEADILMALKLLIENGFVYKGLKPVYWCGHCHTALADAEVEYYDHKSPAVYVKFPVKKAPFAMEKETFVVIWTTTPWTLPANVAVSFHPEFQYSLVESENELYIIAKELVETVSIKTGKQFTEKMILTKNELEKIEIAHPFLENRKVLPVFGTHVTLETGTGAVHTAPGHGQDDYEVGLAYNLPIISPVNHEAKFTEEGGEWAGMHVFDANPLIVEKLKNTGRLLFQEEIAHSYFHCWRCKNPVIYRATPQWFVNVEHNQFREKLLDIAENEVKWLPEWGKIRIKNMLSGRPDWCLSRQRSWGVPIPALVCQDCGKTHLTAQMVEKVADIVRKEGLDIWFSKPVDYFFGADFKCECGSHKFEKEGDILDVWFDSGASWYAVLKRRGLPDADLYLEGSDQHRGWFQSSLIISAGVQKKAPYRSVLTHGFILDEKGKAMHKSAGNVVAPEEIIKEFGADILRLWVTTQDYCEDMRIGKNLINQTADAYRKIRNSFRFLLGNLHGFDYEKDKLDFNDLNPIDKWALSRLKNVIKEVRKAYHDYNFNQVYKTIYHFTNLDLSAFYFDILKDLLYTSKKNGKDRRSALTVMHEIVDSLIKLMAPILVFTAEDIWQNFKPEAGSIHLEEFPKEDKYPHFEQEEADFQKMIPIRETVLKALEIARSEKIIGASLEASLEIETDSPEMKAVLERYQAALPVYFIVSEVHFQLKDFKKTFNSKSQILR